MNEAIINEAIILKYREGFEIMDENALKKHFGISTNNWGIQDHTQHTILSFAWNKVGVLVSFIADPKGVIFNMEKKLRENLKAFERTSDISVNICGKKADGFTFEYIAKDADVKQVGKVLSFKTGRCIYVVQFVTRAESEQEADVDFNTIMAEATLK